MYISKYSWTLCDVTIQITYPVVVLEVLVHHDALLAHFITQRLDDLSQALLVTFR